MRFMGSTILIILGLFIMSSCSRNDTQNNYITNTMIFMDTVCTIKIYDNNDEKTLKGAFDILKRLDGKLSSYIETSDISNINNNAGKKPVIVSKETIQVIQKAINYSEISDGIFDITAYPLIKLWGISEGNTKIPSDNDIKNAQIKIDYKQIKIDTNKNTVYIPENFGLDLGSIAKGYAAELVKEYLDDNDVKSAIINFGGNIDVIGKNINGKEWNIGIKLPFTTTDESIGKISEKNTSIVTSGTYERYFKVGNQIYHHIFNLKTGFPEDNGLESVTIITDNSEDADAISTMVFLKGLDKGYSYVENQSDMEAIFITKDKKVYVTNGIKDNFQLFENDYTMGTIK